LITADACRPLNDHEYRKRDIENTLDMPGDAMKMNRRATSQVTILHAEQDACVKKM
jgi:hypothetical protein